MRLHPLHPMSVHFPIACLLFTPLADLAFVLVGGDVWRTIGALSAAGSVVFGAVAAMLGALDVERAYTKARRIVVAHLSIMIGAVLLSAISAAGRIESDFSIIATPPPWAIAASAAALILMPIGAYFGGEMVYGHAIGVDRES